MVVRDRSCSLRARLKTGLQARSVAFHEGIESRQFGLRGVIQEPYREPGPDHSDPRFNQKEISFSFQTPDNGELLNKIKQREAIDHALGEIVVERDVASRSEKWEDDGELVVVPPVHAYLWVSASAFESFQHLVEAQQADHDLEIELRLGGSSVSRRAVRQWVFLKDLDVSERREYAIVFVRMWELEIALVSN